MPKRFDAPEDKTPIDDLPRVTRGSAFSPFASKVDKRRAVLGKSLLGVAAPSDDENDENRMPDDVIDAKFEKSEELLKNVELGRKNFLRLVQLYQASVAKPDKRSIVELTHEFDEIVARGEAQITMMGLVSNLVYLIKKTGFNVS